MKKIFTLLFSSILFISVTAQLKEDNPVQFKYSVTKISDTKYEVHISANIAEGWHIYSQSFPASSIGRPTQIEFAKNPLVALQGLVKEVVPGAADKKNEEDESKNFYEGKVDFVQAVTLTGKVKTTLRGTIDFQACTNKECLPPDSVDFSIEISAR